MLLTIHRKRVQQVLILKIFLWYPLEWVYKEQPSLPFPETAFSLNMTNRAPSHSTWWKASCGKRNRTYAMLATAITTSFLMNFRLKLSESISGPKILSNSTTVNVSSGISVSDMIFFRFFFWPTYLILGFLVFSLLTFKETKFYDLQLTFADQQCDSNYLPNALN